MSHDSSVSRRDFLKTASFVAASAGAFVGATKGMAQEGVLRAGLIGCGGRGTGAAHQWLAGNENVSVVALADLFEDRLNGCRGSLQDDKGQTITDDMCFTGFDAYQRLIDTDVDVALISEPPYFRQFSFPAAIAAGKHVFMEKPLAVDPVSAKAIMAAADAADAAGLSVSCGTQRRHQKSYIECKKRIDDGAIGQITGARAYWVGSPLGGWDRTDTVTNVGEQVRTWFHHTWLSGDHIVEQHVHNIDIVCWFMDANPLSALGMGYRARKTFGNSYDFFAVDYDMGNGVGMQSLCRQVPECDNNVSEWLIGTEGYANCWGEIWDLDGKQQWRFEGDQDPYVQEHTDLGNAIRTGERINDAHGVARSSMAAIMGRTSAYTGKFVTWDQMMAAEWKLGPDQPLTLDMDYDEGPVPVPGVTTY